MKDTTDTDRSASYIDLHLEIDGEGRLRTKLYDKRDDFNFPILNFPFICSNIPAVNFTVAPMTCSTVMEYLCHKWPRICSTCRKYFPILSSFTTYVVTTACPFTLCRVFFTPKIGPVPPKLKGLSICRGTKLRPKQQLYPIVPPVSKLSGHPELD
jgi:hypothetical protein